MKIHAQIFLNGDQIDKENYVTCNMIHDMCFNTELCSMQAKKV